MGAATPTLPPPRPENLSSSLKRNAEALEKRRRHETAAATRQEELAEAITSFTGSMLFVYLHLALYGAWIWSISVLYRGADLIILCDPGHGGVRRGDFLVHLRTDSQNRTSAAADKRAV